jgi:hypothetical protein
MIENAPWTRSGHALSILLIKARNFFGEVSTRLQFCDGEGILSLPCHPERLRLAAGSMRSANANRFHIDQKRFSPPAAGCSRSG